MSSSALTTIVFADALFIIILIFATLCGIKYICKCCLFKQPSKRHIVPIVDATENAVELNVVPAQLVVYNTVQTRVVPRVEDIV